MGPLKAFLNLFLFLMRLKFFLQLPGLFLAPLAKHFTRFYTLSSLFLFEHFKAQED